MDERIVAEREKIEWLNYWIEDADQNNERVILIGDSVTRELRKRINIYMKGGGYAVDLIAMSYSIMDDMALEEIKHYFDTTPYNYVFIIYHMGAHHGYHIECAESSKDMIQYGCRIKEILSVLNMYEAKVVSVSSTYERTIDENGNIISNHNSEIEKRNQILSSVSEEMNIPFLDLNKKIQYQNMQYTDWCHFYEDCYEYIAKLIIDRFFPDIEYTSSNQIRTVKELREKLDVHKDKKIYIYGNSIRGKNIYRYLEKRGYSFNGFIVSMEYAENMDDVLTINHVNNKDSIIIVTPLDVGIWKELKIGEFNYFSLNSDIYKYIYMDNDML